MLLTARCMASAIMNHGTPLESVKYRRLAPTLIGKFTPVVLTVNVTPLLAAPPTVTATSPVVAPVGTGTTILIALQFVGVAAVPLKVTVLVPCIKPKFIPVIVTDVPTGPDVGFRLVIDGGIVTVNVTPLLAVPPTVTTTFPVVAPAGTGTTILVMLQFVGAAVVPLNVTVLVPCI